MKKYLRFKSSFIITIALICGTATAAPQPAHPRLGEHLHELGIGASPNVIWIGTHGETAVSDDGGMHWHVIRALHGIDAMEMSITPDGKMIVVAGHYGIRISRDGGRTWTNANRGLPSRDDHGFGFDLRNIHHMAAYVVGHGMYVSDDGGVRWTALGPLHLPPTVEMPMGDIYVRGNRIMIPVMMSGFALSTDGGKTWKVVGQEVSGMDLHTARSNPNMMFFSGMQQGLFISKDGGKTWIHRVLPLGAEITSGRVGGVMYAAGYDDGRPYLWKSSDTGRTWHAIAAPWPWKW